MLKVGSFVLWLKCPHSAWQRGQIVEVRGDLGRLRHFATFHRLSEFEPVEPTGAERKQCLLYHLPVAN